MIPQNYLGIGSAKAVDDQHLEFTTLEMAMQKNGDHGKKITYLKLDIEQSEVEVLRELIDSAWDIFYNWAIQAFTFEFSGLYFVKKSLLNDQYDFFFKF